MEGQNSVAPAKDPLNPVNQSSPKAASVNCAGISTPGYNPRWRKVKYNKQWCSINQCSSEGKLWTKLVTGVHDLESILGAAVRPDAKTLVGPLPLCQEQMYKTLKPPSSCSTVKLSHYRPLSMVNEHGDCYHQAASLGYQPLHS